MTSLKELLTEIISYRGARIVFVEPTFSLELCEIGLCRTKEKLWRIIRASGC